MRVSILQPTYWARAHVWNRVASSDCFVWLDDVKFSRSATKWEDRTVIEGRDQRSIVLRLPMRGSTSNLWKDVGINQGWQRHATTVLQCYANAPNKSCIVDAVERVYGSDASAIDEVCWRSFSAVLELLRLPCKVIRSSELTVTTAKGELVLDLVKRMGGSSYLSGEPGMSYLPLDQFEDAGIQVIPQRWIAPVTRGGLHNPSILHLLAHTGVERTTELVSTAHAEAVEVG